MYWQDSKEKTGWDPMWLPENIKYEIAMRILFPQSYQIFLHYWINACKRISLKLTDENLQVVRNVFNNSYKNELLRLFTKLTPQKRFELSMKTIGKISIGPFYNTNFKKESFMDIWENPDIYKVLDWDITAPYDFEKQEYIAEKVQYSISYEQFRFPHGRNRKKSTLELDRVIEIMKPLWDTHKNASYLGCSNNEYYKENGIIKVRKYNP